MKRGVAVLVLTVHIRTGLEKKVGNFDDHVDIAMGIVGIAMENGHVQRRLPIPAFGVDVGPEIKEKFDNSE
jgi:hypothetical protein